METLSYLIYFIFVQIIPHLQQTVSVFRFPGQNVIRTQFLQRVTVLLKCLTKIPSILLLKIKFGNLLSGKITRESVLTELSG